MVKPLPEPPWLKDTFRNLNRGQQTYAIRQHNRARESRGLEPVDIATILATYGNGVPQNVDSDRTDSISEAETIPLRPNRDRSRSPIRTEYNNDQPDFGGNSSHSPFDTDYRVNTNRHQQTRPANNPISDTPRRDSPQPGPSNISVGEGDMATPQPMDTGAGNPQVTRSGDPATLPGTKRKKLPGTAQGQGSTESGHPRLGAIERPMQGTTSLTLMFKKVHRFFTYGVGAAILSKDENGATNYFLTTSLAEIPWDRPFMYMNPSEYMLLPAGSFCKYVKCHITSRNVRVAFPTNSSNSDLATLNQNKDICYSIGLNTKLPGINVRYTAFSPDDPMVPTACETNQGHNSYTPYSEAFYGVDNDNPNFRTKIPHHQIGKPFALKQYYCMTTNNKEISKSGWPCLQTFMTDWDADEISGDTVCSMSYTPDVAPLNAPIKSIYTGYPFPRQNQDDDKYTYTVPDGSNHPIIPTKKSYDFSTAARGLTGTSSTQEVTEAIEDNKFEYHGLIEKGQLMYNQSCLSRDACKVQPSIHVGVMPCLALNTLSSLTNMEKYTDTQGCFEVVCEMGVEFGLPTHRPFAKKANISVGNELLQTNDTQVVDTDRSAINGLYLERTVAAVRNNK